MRKYINEVSDLKIGKTWDFAIKFLIPSTLFFFIGQTLLKNIAEPYGEYPEWAVWSFGWGVILAILLISAALSLFTRDDQGKQQTTK